MKTVVGAWKEQVEIGEARSHGVLTMVPLLGGAEPGFAYLGLSEALSSGAFLVTEASPGGSVPELVVQNDGPAAVLVVNGEELVGAKQNRVLNTSVLVPASAKLVLPVSCTEAGRWFYRSRVFADSDLVSPYRVRLGTNRSVHASVWARGEHSSDQGAVWAAVASLAEDADVRSPTAAMRDIYTAHETAVEGVVAAFPLHTGQRGVIALMEGRVLGLDWVSRPEVYAALHPKLVRSYAVEIVARGNGDEAGEDADASAVAAAVEQFLGALSAATESAHPGVGLGMEHRVTGKDVFGASLVHDGEVLHVGAFAGASNDAAVSTSRMARLGARRAAQGRRVAGE